jgi:carbon-monoxide dehydrogenase medium subunit
MKPPVFAYERPETWDEALALRAEHGAGSAVLAGGQSLLPLLNFRLAQPALVIDLGGTVSQTAWVRRRDGGIAVGPMARQRDLELDSAAAAANPLIRETLQHVAHGVVRNRGTVVGSVAHGDASAELPTLLVTLGGTATAARPDSERTVLAEDLYSFHLTTTLEPDELLAEVWFPDLPPGAGYGFVEFARRHGDYALCGVCAVVELADDRTVQEVRIGYSGVATRPVRSPAAEDALRGREPTPAVLERAGDAAAAQVVDASAAGAVSQDYRRHLVRRLTARVLADAVRRAEDRRENA